MLFADAVFNIFAGIFMFSMMFAKTSLLFCCFCIRFFQTSMLLFVSVCCYAKARCYYLCPYAVMRKLDAILCSNPSAFLVSSDVRPSNDLTFCNVSTRQGFSIC